MSVLGLCDRIGLKRNITVIPTIPKLAFVTSRRLDFGENRARSDTALSDFFGASLNEESRLPLVGGAGHDQDEETIT